MADGQQQQQGDNSLDFLWICGIIVVGITAIWYFGHVYIVMGVFYTRLAEIALINYVFEGINYLIHLVGVKYTLGPYFSEWISYIYETDPKEVEFDEIVALSTAVGDYLRFPIALIMFVFAWWLYSHHVNMRFNHIYDMKRLRSVESQNWPQITPVINKNLDKVDIEEGRWAMANTPIQFGRKYNLLNYTSIEGQPRAYTDKGMAHRVFAVQLGPLWRGAHKLPVHARSLFAAFAAKANRDDKACKDLLHSIASSATSDKLDYTGTDELLNKYGNTRLVRYVVSRHAYVMTVLPSMLDLARTDGVLSCADFLWLKMVDRRLWYTLNNVGHQTAVPEIAGIFAHWKAENAFGRPLKVPMVDQAVEGFQTALENIIYDPEEETDEAGKEV